MLVDVKKVTIMVDVDPKPMVAFEVDEDMSIVQTANQ